MGALGQPVAIEHRFAAGRGGNDDVLVLGGQFWTRHRHHLRLAQLTHFIAEVAAVIFVRTVDLHPPNFAHLAHGQQLCARLFAAAEETYFAGIGTGHVLRGHAAGGPGAHLPQVIGLHQGEQGAALAVVQPDVEVGALAAGAVRLVAHHAQGLGGAAHDVQQGVVGLRAGARDVDRLVQGQLAQAVLDGLQGHFHRQELADVVFREQQHGSHDDSPWQRSEVRSQRSEAGGNPDF